MMLFRGMYFVPLNNVKPPTPHGFTPTRSNICSRSITPSPNRSRKTVRFGHKSVP